MNILIILVKLIFKSVLLSNQSFPRVICHDVIVFLSRQTGVVSHLCSQGQHGTTTENTKLKEMCVCTCV